MDEDIDPVETFFAEIQLGTTEALAALETFTTHTDLNDDDADLFCATLIDVIDHATKIRLNDAPALALLYDKLAAEMGTDRDQLSDVSNNIQQWNQSVLAGEVPVVTLTDMEACQHRSLISEGATRNGIEYIHIVAWSHLIAALATNMGEDEGVADWEACLARTPKLTPYQLARNIPLEFERGDASLLPTLLTRLERYLQSDSDKTEKKSTPEDALDHLCMWYIQARSFHLLFKTQTEAGAFEPPELPLRVTGVDGEDTLINVSVCVLARVLRADARHRACTSQITLDRSRTLVQDLMTNVLSPLGDTETFTLLYNPTGNLDQEILDHFRPAVSKELFGKKLRAWGNESWRRIILCKKEDREKMEMSESDRFWIEFLVFYMSIEANTGSVAATNAVFFGKRRWKFWEHRHINGHTPLFCALTARIVFVLYHNTVFRPDTGNPIEDLWLCVACWYVWRAHPSSVKPGGFPDVTVELDARRRKLMTYLTQVMLEAIASSRVE